MRLTSREVSRDRALVRARERADDGDRESAEAGLQRLVDTAIGDPLRDVARVELARLRVARGDLDGAVELLAALPADLDPALALRRDLVRGLVHARRNEVAAGLAAVRPLARRMIDAANTAETDCALASLEAADHRPYAALLALARVESQAEHGARWMPTGLACDAPAERSRELTRLVGQVQTPRALADALDALPPEHPTRVEVARRLRTLAVEANQIQQWLPWLADLPDTEATLRVVRDDQGPAPLRVGVLAPMSGPRAVIGTEILRAVQVALDDQRAVEIEAGDEFDAPLTMRTAVTPTGDGQMARGGEAHTTGAQLRHLLDLAPTAIVGPALEEHALDVARTAQAAGVDVYLLAPHDDRAGALGEHVFEAGPPPSMRAAALAAAARTRGTRVRWAAAPGSERTLFPMRVRASLGLAGVTAVEGAALASAEPHLVLGAWSFEGRSQIEAFATRAPTRWIFDARSGPAGAPGVWVGAMPSEGEALSSFRSRYCALTGRPPGELALLAHDAARRIVERARNVPAVRVFASPWRITKATVGGDGEGPLAVTHRCPTM